MSAPSRMFSILSRRPMMTLTLGLIALVLVVRGVWGWHGTRAMEAEIALVRERGEPVASDEFVLEPVPDHENAWPLQTQAATITMGTGVDSPASSVAEYRDYAPFSVEWIRTAAASEQAHAAAFTLARRARERPRARVMTVLPPSFSKMQWGGLNNIRNLANIVGDGAIFQHLQGNDVEALERCRDVLHVARSVRTDPLVVHQLVAIGIDALACARIQAIAPGLRLSDAAARDATRRLIDDLLDERFISEGFGGSFMGERVLLIGHTEEVIDGTFFLDPAARMQAAAALQVHATLIGASVHDDAIAVRAALADIPRTEPAVIAFLFGTPARRMPRYSRWFDIEVGGLARYFETYHRVIGDRRMSAVILALQLYRHDHGRWPERLEELVPAYLTALPRDPFSGTGAPIGYVVLKSGCPDGSDRPLVYVDHGDPVNTIDDEPMIGWQMDRSDVRPRREFYRQYRDVSRWMPVTPRKEVWPAPTAALRQQRIDGDPDVADGPGEESEAEE